jgi:hypothetical protein
MHGQDEPGHNASQGQVSTARRFGKPAEDVKTYDAPRHAGMIGALSEGARALPGTGPCEPRDTDAGSDRLRPRHGSGFGGQGPMGQVSAWHRHGSTFGCERRPNLNTGDSKVLCLDRVICKTFLA